MWSRDVFVMVMVLVMVRRVLEEGGDGAEGQLVGGRGCAKGAAARLLRCLPGAGGVPSYDLVVCAGSAHIARWKPVARVRGTFV